MSNIKKVTKDSYLFRDGDQPDAMYIVKAGQFNICKKKGSGEVILATVGPGALVGEMALFDSKPRSADIKAAKDSEVMMLPYENLRKELEALPVWLKAVLKSLNEHIRESNKKIRALESGNINEERFSPHTINKLISILNFVSMRYGKPSELDGGLIISSHLLRNYTIQIFQEATNKMQAMVDTLCEMGLMKSEDRGDGTQKLTYLQLDEMFRFVEWHNDWLFKQEKDKTPALNPTETQIFEALLKFAEKVPADAKTRLHHINLNDVQNDSMREVGFLIKVDDAASLIEKKYVPEKLMTEQGIFLTIDLGASNQVVKHWKLINELKKRLR